MFKIEPIPADSIYDEDYAVNIDKLAKQLTCGYCGCSHPTTKIDRPLINKWICTYCMEEIYDEVYQRIAERKKADYREKWKLPQK